jgi:5-formyltetrahydrofolate cyclo-ligase
MVAKAAADQAEPPGLRKEGAWKWEMRKRVWDYMEANDIAW